MTDKKWKSVMILADSHTKIKDLSAFYRLPINQTLEYLVERAWIAAFNKDAQPSIQVPSTPVFRSKA